MQYNELMGKGLVAAVLTAGITVGISVASGCSYGAGAFRCSADNQCGAGGACEPDNLCSAPSATCASGRAYSDLSGDRSGQCIGTAAVVVDAGEVPDAPIAIDAPIVDAATACFGTGLVKLCLAAPTAAIVVSAPTTIDTDDPATCAAVLSGGDGLCVIAATEIRIDAKLRATGTKPLVLLASMTITTTAQLDVGSHRGATPELGAGADPAGCATGTAPGSNGGGAGGSFTGPGGRGGSPNAGMPGAIVDPITALRGGCAGQDGDGGTRGQRGHGGGAVFLIAGSQIDARGGINAAGEGGSGGTDNRAGGGGAGAGGLIGFDAPTIMLAGLILANGGGGGEGAGQSTPGNPGADPSSTAAAAGGRAGTSNGGDGGSGSSGNAAGAGNAANSGGSQGGGGGGGGGAGAVRVPAGASTTDAQISPTPTT